MNGAPPVTDFRQRVQALMRPDRQPIKAEIPGVKGDRSTAIIRLYDSIDSYGEFWGVSANEFATVLDSLPESILEIRLLINSPGGEVFEGIAILNQLRNHPARTVAVVEGIAASAASFIAAGCDELIMSKNAELMVHDAWGLCVGNADDMTQMAENLGRISDNIASIYADKAGGTTEDWRAVMAAESWFSADEAVSSGLADSLIDSAPEDDAKPANRFDLSIFNFAGRAQAPEPKIPADHQDVGSRNTPPPQGGSAVAFSDEQLTDLRQKLDVTEDADEATILAALDGLIEQITAPSTEDDDSPALPDGVVAISEGQLEELRADAQAGREARAEQIRSERTALVVAAISDGRIAPAERDAWLAKLDAGTGAEQVLASLKPGIIPVGEPVGAAGAADLDTEFNEYNAIYGKEATV